MGVRAVETITASDMTTPSRSASSEGPIYTSSLCRHEDGGDLAAAACYIGTRHLLEALASRELGVGGWPVFTQEHLDQFTDATLERQSIHLDSRGVEGSI